MSVRDLARLELQEEEEDLEIPKQVPWPELPQEALYGLAGDYVSKIEPHTEADPAGILVQFLVMFGNLIGRRPHFRVEADRHYFNLFAVVVGDSSKGRKGVSAGQAKRLFEDVDPDWCTHRFLHGLSSGEGLIWSVRDPIEESVPTKKGKTSTGETRTKLVDPGVDDKRLLVMESEFASVLQVMKRQGNTLSAIIRNSWDSGRLNTMTKNNPAKATDAHISILGHITKMELLRHLDSTETANGFGNRFLWCCVKRSRYLPEGGMTHTLDFSEETRLINECVDFSRRTEEMKRDSEARAIWARVYRSLSEGKPGLLGAMIGRAEAQTMRLAGLYALLDQSDLIRAKHLTAALALWTYCEKSAVWIFGDSLGDPIADEILRALHNSLDGLTRSEISGLFKRHRKTHEIGRALTILFEQDLAICVAEKTSGRTAKRWKLNPKRREISEKSEAST